MQGSELRGRVVSLGDYRINSVESRSPSPDKEWLVFLNGLCVPAEFYVDPFLEKLSEGYNIFAPSINGIDIGGDLPMTVGDLRDITIDVIKQEIGTEYHVWGHSTGGTTGLLFGELRHPPKSTLAVQPILSTHTTGKGLHRRSLYSSVAAHIVNSIALLAHYRSAPDRQERIRKFQHITKEKMHSVLGNWNAIKEKKAGWPLLDDIAEFSYEGRLLPQPSRIYLSDHDGLFAPTVRNVEQLHGAAPNSQITVLTQSEMNDYKFTPHHSWPLFYDTLARQILIEDNVPPGAVRGPIDNETLIAPWHWTSMRKAVTTGALAGLVAAGIVAYAKSSSKRL